MEQQDCTGKNEVSNAKVSSSRRNFMKLCSAATVGGVSSLILPRSPEAQESLDLLKIKASQDSQNELFWRFVRAQFVLKPKLTYMNTGTEGSMPRCVLSRLKSSFKEFAQNPWDAVVEHDCYCYFMWEIVDTLAPFLGATAEETILTTNTTEGMGYVANGLELSEGDEVLSCMHFSPYDTCWKILRDRRSIVYTEVELPTPASSKDELIAAFESAITPQTKVMSFCHINYSTGLRMPVEELCNLAREHNIITVVDGAHAPGMINVDLKELGCDFYAGSLHKWLNGPPGTGFLYMRQEAQHLLWPTISETYPSPANKKMEFQIRGQQCTPAYTGLIDAVDFQNAIGKEKIEERVLALSSYLKEKIIEQWPDAHLYSPVEDELSTGLVSFNPFDDPYAKDNPSIVAKTLRADYNTILRYIWFKDRHSDTKALRALRVSTHIYNNFDEIDRLINNLQKIIATL
jgi:selenocysteine lyase/cysteine desulfurase